MAYRKTKKYSQKRRKTFKAKKRTARKAAKKASRKKTSKIPVKRVRGFKRAVKKVMDGDRDIGTFVIAGRQMLRQTVQDRWGIYDFALARYNDLAYNFGTQQEYLNAAAVLFGGNDPNSLNLNTIVGAFPVDEKLRLVSDHLDLHFTNDGQLPTMLEIYEATCVADTNSTPFAMMNAESDEYDVQHWGLNPDAGGVGVEGIVQNYGAISGTAGMDGIDAELNKYGGQLIRKSWRVKTKRVVLNPQSSFHHALKRGSKSWNPANTMTQNGSVALPAFLTYQKGCVHLSYRVLRKVTATNNNKPTHPANGAGYGIVLNWKKVVKMVSPNVPVAAGGTFKTGKIMRYLNVSPVAGTAGTPGPSNIQYIEPDGDLANVDI